SACFAPPPHHRDLHSFPTRRSSDLGERRAGREGRCMTATRRARAAYARMEAVQRPEVWIALRPVEDALADAARVDERLAAGEEQIGRAHAELQSRFDLVCRLLLEKK